MTVLYVLDTDWAIEYLHARQKVVRRLRDLFDEGLELSAITLAELYEGVYSSRDPQNDEQDLNDFLRGVAVLGVDESVCRIFGKERGRLRSVGTLIGDFDLLIGATALRHDAILLTNNRKHFDRIEGLRIESL